MVTTNVTKCQTKINEVFYIQLMFYFVSFALNKKLTFDQIHRIMIYFI